MFKKSEQVCEMFGMCEKNQNKLENKHDLFYNIENISKNSNEECILCQFVMKLLTKYISENSTEVSSIV
jgi:hypothetical protein